MSAYKVVYAESFPTSLKFLIDQWENELFLPPESSQQFVAMIQRSVVLAKGFPEMYEEVSQIYQMHEPTYCINIGKIYAIFYRINKVQKGIFVGSIFQTKQMKVVF